MKATPDPRIGELLAWEVETGQPLPMPAAEIVAHEDAGRIVDLVAGTIHTAPQATRVQATPLGEALGVLMELDEVRP